MKRFFPSTTGVRLNFTKSSNWGLDLGPLRHTYRNESSFTLAALRLGTDRKTNVRVLLT